MFSVHFCLSFYIFALLVYLCICCSTCSYILTFNYYLVRSSDGCSFCFLIVLLVTNHCMNVFDFIYIYICKRVSIESGEGEKEKIDMEDM